MTRRQRWKWILLISTLSITIQNVLVNIQWERSRCHRTNIHKPSPPSSIDGEENVEELGDLCSDHILLMSTGFPSYAGAQVFRSTMVFTWRPINSCHRRLTRNYENNIICLPVDYQFINDTNYNDYTSSAPPTLWLTEIKWSDGQRFTCYNTAFLSSTSSIGIHFHLYN